MHLTRAGEYVRARFLENHYAIKQGLFIKNIVQILIEAFFC